MHRTQEIRKFYIIYLVKIEEKDKKERTCNTQKIKNKDMKSSVSINNVLTET